MKSLRPFLSLLPALCVVACQVTEREVIVERGPGTGSPPGFEWGAPEAQAEGGVDSGGGNGLEGRMLESYKKPVQEVPAFADKVLPVILNLARVYPRLASDLWHIARERSWYFIPGRLDRLPSHRIGVSLKTDQYALQNRKEIWLDEILFDEMRSDDERAKLILHELVMGVRMMAFQDPLDECLSSVALGSLGPGSAEFYRKQRQACFQRAESLQSGSSLLSPKKIEISNEDYMAIRDLVGVLWAHQGQVDADELKSWLKIRKFRNYSN